METKLDFSLMHWLAIYRKIVGQLVDILLLADGTGEVIWAEFKCDDFPKLRTLKEMVALIHSDDRMEATRLLFEPVASEMACKETFRIRCANGEWRWMEVSVFRLSIGEDEFIVIALNDVTVRKKKEEELRNMAFHDPLTGLPNRRLFREHLERALFQAKCNGHLLAILYLDIDHFKQINDRMGHDIGDLFLISFAKRLKGYVREIDTFARLGGDEFAILLPFIGSSEEAEIVAKQMLKAASSGWDVAGICIKSTLSIGISIYPIDGVDEEMLLRHVDKAMYEVKNGGRNGYKFYCQNGVLEMGGTEWPE